MAAFMEIERHKEETLNLSLCVFFMYTQLYYIVNMNAKLLLH